MPQTVADAFTQAEDTIGRDFDLAVGYEKERRKHRETPEAVELAWRGFRATHEIQRMARQLVSMVPGTDTHEAEDAIQDTYAVLWVRRPDVFQDPKAMLGMVSNYARKRLLKIRDLRGPTMLSLDLAVDPKSDADPEREGSNTKVEITPAVAYFKAGVDEEARFTPPPERGSPWERLQVIGVVQRWRDQTGKSPTTIDFKKSKDLPTLARVKQLGWHHLNDLFLEAGVPIERVTPQRRWTPIRTAEVCYAFRKREGFWPGHFDAVALPPGTLPGIKAMQRYLGGTTPQDVQAGCEAILGPIDRPTASTDGSLTARLVAEREREREPDALVLA